jgi:hypothetical protein
MDLRQPEQRLIVEVCPASSFQAEPWILRHHLDGTTHVSRPLVPTFPIHTGPQVQCRDGQLPARDGPIQDRFGMAGQTFGTGHGLLLSGKLERGYHRRKRMGLARSLVRSSTIEKRGSRRMDCEELGGVTTITIRSPQGIGAF